MIVLLPDPGGPDQRRHLAGRGIEVEVGEDRSLLAVVEVHVPERDVATLDLEVRPVGVGVERRLGVEDAVDELHADHAPLDADAGVGEALGGLVGEQDGGDEGHEGAGPHALVDRLVARPRA